MQQLNFEATTDLRLYGAQGIEGFGITPFTTQENLHGIDESIRFEDLALGQRVTHQFLVNFCC